MVMDISNIRETIRMLSRPVFLLWSGDGWSDMVNSMRSLELFPSTLPPAQTRDRRDLLSCVPTASRSLSVHLVSAADTNREVEDEGDR